MFTICWVFGALRYLIRDQNESRSLGHHMANGHASRVCDALSPCRVGCGGAEKLGVTPM